MDKIRQRQVEYLKRWRRFFYKIRHKTMEFDEDYLINTIPKQIDKEYPELEALGVVLFIVWGENKDDNVVLNLIEQTIRKFVDPEDPIIQIGVRCIAPETANRILYEELMKLNVAPSWETNPECPELANETVVRVGPHYASWDRWGFCGGVTDVWRDECCTFSSYHENPDQWTLEKTIDWFLH